MHSGSFCCYFRLNIFWTARKMLLCVYSRIWFIWENFPNSKYWANSKLIGSRVVVIIEIIYRITWISIPHWNIRRRGYRAKSISHWMNGWQSHSDSGNTRLPQSIEIESMVTAIDREIAITAIITAQNRENNRELHCGDSSAIELSFPLKPKSKNLYRGAYQMNRTNVTIGCGWERESEFCIWQYFVWKNRCLM